MENEHSLFVRLLGVESSNGTGLQIMHESAHDRRRIGPIEEKVVCGRPLLREVKVVPKVVGSVI